MAERSGDGVHNTETDQIAAYVEAVRAALSGIPEATRADLLKDLPEQLAAVVADEVGPISERLGPPAVYAADLLARAGYVGGGFPDPPTSRYESLAGLQTIWAERLRVLDDKSGFLFGYDRASDFFKLLRPGWWVLRGYVLAMAIAEMLNANGGVGLLPRVGGSGLVALVLLAVCVLASIWFGRGDFTLARGARLGLWGGTAALILVAMYGFLSNDSLSRWTTNQEVDYTSPYDNVRDVYVYDQHGRLVDGARLFDQDGQPIKLGEPYCEDSDITSIDDSKYPYCGASSAPFKDVTGSPEPTSSPSPSPSK